ncbi:class I SAM-dependent methyltransferase [Allorhodopirellula solitaria]|uniref:class I SAM-dependent methyltransferase n=1 Tax=Allorhodopirellula solitaria TaxID=2527987 RepID=UPI001648FAA5|nr:methyltransferase domain-containing protein [Allorhodopirellula solitaria]
MNVDFVPADRAVLAANLRESFPFEDSFFDVVYSSHVLEHFTRKEANQFIQECMRILKPGGVVRIVVPDLELLCRKYLGVLNRVRQGGELWELDWSVIQIVDQLAREKSGGQMKEMLNSVEKSVLKQLANTSSTARRIWVERNGDEDKQTHASSPSVAPRQHTQTSFGGIKGRLKRFLVSKLCPEYSSAACSIGRFRMSGEVHKWMYDAIQLQSLLTSHGFVDFRVQDPLESMIRNWDEFGIDIEPDGSPYKPDSIYVESLKLV